VCSRAPPAAAPTSTARPATPRSPRYPAPSPSPEQAAMTGHTKHRRLGAQRRWAQAGQQPRAPHSRKPCGPRRCGSHSPPRILTTRRHREAGGRHGPAGPCTNRPCTEGENHDHHQATAAALARQDRDCSTVCARRQVTTDELPRRTIRTSRRPRHHRSRAPAEIRPPAQSRRSAPTETARPGKRDLYSTSGRAADRRRTRASRRRGGPG
jgi:hypothetical protein